MLMLMANAASSIPTSCLLMVATDGSPVSQETAVTYIIIVGFLPTSSPCTRSCVTWGLPFPVSHLAPMEEKNPAVGSERRTNVPSGSCHTPTNSRVHFFF